MVLFVGHKYLADSTRVARRLYLKVLLESVVAAARQHNDKSDYAQQDN